MERLGARYNGHPSGTHCQRFIVFVDSISEDMVMVVDKEVMSGVEYGMVSKGFIAHQNVLESDSK